MSKSKTPLKLFDDKVRSVRLMRLTIDFGILFCSIFLDKSILSIEYDENSPICPVSLLLRKFKYFKDSEEKHQEGIVPFNKLFCIFKENSFENPLIFFWNFTF